ncbi:MAG: DUF2460 domain-containing protein [Phycisphaerae bacterium]
MPAPFLEIQFPEKISYGSDFGPAWNTDVVEVSSGREVRTQQWANPLYAGNVALGVKSPEEMRELIAFFHEVRGRTYGFRYKDWGDYQATDEALAPDGGPEVQLRKTYGTGLNDYTRKITKPVSITLKRDGSTITEYSLDTETGIVTLDADSTASIDDIARDSSGTVTAAGHGFSTGDEIHISDVNGMTEVNGEVYEITRVDDDTFELGIDTSEFDEYTSGGTAAKYVQSDEELTWSGEFDVPCRFEENRITTSFDAYDSLSASVPIREVRV